MCLKDPLQVGDSECRGLSFVDFKALLRRGLQGLVCEWKVEVQVFGRV